jgi:hypothetical protein
LIHDAIGTTHECIHSIKQKHLKALLLKLDLQKAFDCVNWDFLRLILIQVGFGPQLTSWILECVSSASIVVLVNGEATNFFKQWITRLITVLLHFVALSASLPFCTHHLRCLFFRFLCSVRHVHSLHSSSSVLFSCCTLLLLHT